MMAQASKAASPKAKPEAKSKAKVKQHHPRVTLAGFTTGSVALTVRVGEDLVEFKAVYVTAVTKLNRSQSGGHAVGVPNTPSTDPETSQGQLPRLLCPFITSPLDHYGHARKPIGLARRLGMAAVSPLPHRVDVA